MGTDKQGELSGMPAPTELEMAAENYLNMKEEFNAIKEEMDGCAGILASKMREAKTYKLTMQGQRVELKHVDKYEIKINKTKAA